MKDGEYFQAWCSTPGCWYSKSYRTARTARTHADTHRTEAGEGHRCNVWHITYSNDVFVRESPVLTLEKLTK